MYNVHVNGTAEKDHFWDDVDGATAAQQLLRTQRPATQREEEEEQEERGGTTQKSREIDGYVYSKRTPQPRADRGQRLGSAMTQDSAESLGPQRHIPVPYVISGTRSYPHIHCPC